jgi:hypothetical protein
VPSGPLEIKVGGLSYRLKTDVDPSKLRRLAAIVDEHVSDCNPLGKLSPTQALLYAALTLAEQLDQERTINQTIESTARDSLNQMLYRIDAAIDAVDPFLATSPKKAPIANSAK